MRLIPFAFAFLSFAAAAQELPLGGIPISAGGGGGGTAPTFVSSTNNYAENVSSITCPTPTGVAAGDALVAIVTNDGAAQTITFPAGWTKVTTDSVTNGDQQTVSWGWKVATGSDSYAFGVTNNTGNSGCVVAVYSGAAASPIDVYSAANNPNSATAPSSAVTVTATGITTTAVDTVVFLGMVDTNGLNGTWTAPGGMTLRGQVSSGGYFSAAAIADLSQTSAGATGNLSATWTQSGAVGNPVGYLVGIKGP